MQAVAITLQASTFHMISESVAISKDDYIVQLKTYLLDLKNSYLAALNHRVGLILQYQSQNSDTSQLYLALAEIQEKLQQITDLNSQIADLQRELYEKTYDITKLKMEKQITENYQVYRERAFNQQQSVTYETSSLIQRPDALRSYMEADEIPERPIKMPEKLPERYIQTSALIKQLRAQRSQFLKEISELREENRSLQEKQSKEELKERTENETTKKYGTLLRSYTQLYYRMALLVQQNDDLRALTESKRIQTQKASLQLSPGSRTSPSIRYGSQMSGQGVRSSVLSANGDAVAKIEQLKALNQQQKGRIDYILKDKNQLFAKNQTLVLETTRLKTALQEANRRLERFSRVFMDYGRMQRGAGDLKKRLLALKVHLHKDDFCLQIDEISKANQRYFEISAFKLHYASYEGYEARMRLAWTADQLEQLKITRNNHALASSQAIYRAREEWDYKFKHLFVRYITLSEEVPLLTQCEEFLKQQSYLISERFLHFDERIRDLASEVDVFDAEMLRGTTVLGELQASVAEAMESKVDDLYRQIAERESENRQREVEMSEFKHKAAYLENSQQEFKTLEQRFVYYRAEDLYQLKAKTLLADDLDGKLQTANSSLEKAENIRVQLEARCAELYSRIYFFEYQIETKTSEIAYLKDAIKQPYDQKSAQFSLLLEEKSVALAKAQRKLDIIYAEQREYVENMEKSYEQELRKLRIDIYDSEKRTAAAKYNAQDNLQRTEDTERQNLCLRKQLNEQQAESRQALLNCEALLQREISALRASLAEAEDYALAYYNYLKFVQTELQSAEAQFQHDMQQLTLRIDEYAANSTDYEHKVQQLTNSLAEQQETTYCVWKEAQDSQLELAAEKQKVMELTEQHERKLYDIAVKLEEQTLKWQQSERNLEDVREKLAVAHQAKNDEVRGLLSQIGALYHEIEEYKRTLTNYNETIYGLESEKLDLIYRCSYSTQDCQTLGEELKRSRNAVYQLQYQLSERKASKNSQLQQLSKQNESLSDEVKQLREDNNTLYQNVKQQILLMQRNCEQREAELYKQLHAREAEIYDLYVSVEKAQYLCSNYQLELETAKSSLLTNMISGTSEQQNSSEACQYIREQIDYNAELQQRVQLLEKEKIALGESTQLALATKEGELSDVQAKLLSVQSKLEEAERMISEKQAELAEKHAIQLRYTYSHLAYIDELGSKLIAKDDEMVQLQHEVESLSAYKLSYISKQMDLQTELYDSVVEIQHLRAQLAYKQSAKAAKAELSEQIAQLTRQAAENAQARAVSEGHLEEQAEQLRRALYKAETEIYQTSTYNEALRAEGERLSTELKEMQSAQGAAARLRLQNQAQEIASLGQEIAVLKYKNEYYRKELAERAANALAMSGQAAADQRAVERQDELFQRVKCEIRRFEAENESYATCTHIQERALALAAQISGLHERIHTAFEQLAGKGQESSLKEQVEALASEKLQLVQRQVHLQEQLQESHSMQALYQQYLLAAQDQMNQMYQAHEAGAKRKQARK